MPTAARRSARIVAGAGAVAAAVAAAQWANRRRRGSWDVHAGEPITPEATRARAEALLALPRVRRRDEVLTFAPTPLTSVDLLLHGRRYFPRILEDIAAARDHVHMLFYAFRPGSIADAFIEVLTERAAAGIDVRVAVDAMGSRIDLAGGRLYRRLRDAGARVVANDGLVVMRGGHLGERRLLVHAEDVLHFDHRKMMVIDGRIGYVGGTGIEDHFADGRFTDVMCRVMGPVVKQIQLAFIASWVKDGGPAPGGLDGLFPPDTTGPAARPVAGLTVTVLMNVPGTGHHPIRDAIFRGLDDAGSTVDIVNPYISNRAVIRRLVDAARRGAAVRVIVPSEPRPPFPMAAFRAWYPELLGAGVRIVRHPGMAHAKVYRFDDVLLIGSCNLDDLSLYRNDELDLRFEGPGVESLAGPVFDELIAASSPASASSRWRSRAWERLVARSSRLL